jgi:hypothetical protein
MANEVKVRRPIFMVSHYIDELGIPGSAQANASGIRFDLPLASGDTWQIDRIDMRNVAITSNVATTFRVNFFHSVGRGGVQWNDSTYVGGFDIACASGVPEDYSAGVFYGNAYNSTYGQGVSCYLPYFDDDHTATRSGPITTHYVHATIQNIGSSRASPVKIIVMYEPANADYNI